MLGRLLLFIVLIPLIELALLNQLLQHSGFPTMIIVVLLTGVLGINLARRQGMKAWKSAHQQMAQGKSPSKEIMDGVMILLAGAFLITPGILTDCVGFSLLVPQLRFRLGRWLMAWFKARTVSTFQVQSWPDSPLQSDDDTSDHEGPTVRVIIPDDAANTQTDALPPSR